MDLAPVVVVAVVVLVLALGLLLIRARPAPRETATAPRPGFTFGSAIRRALGSSLDEGTWDAIEDALLAADVGVATTTDIIERLRASRPTGVSEAQAELRVGLVAAFSEADRALSLSGAPAVVMVVGVNGTGKTTTIAKLAKLLVDTGRSVMLGAADTFRAAAGAQLRSWGDRVGVPVITGQEGGDPASVAFDTLDSARARGVDVVIIDTAGRLHGKKNLMTELTKIHRVCGGEGVGEVLLVLDASLGQNGLAQVGEFGKAVPITGIVLTKLDGTARGGIVIAVERDMGVPVKFVGVGEGLDDLDPFDPDSFVDSLLEGP